MPDFNIPLPFLSVLFIYYFIYIYFLSPLAHWCDPPQTSLIISAGDRLIRLSLNRFKCSRPISAPL